MSEKNEMILANLIAARAEQKPDLDILTFEGAGIREDEIRTYADLWQNGNRIAKGLIKRGMQVGDRFALFMRNHPEFVDTMVAASISGCVFVPVDPRTKGAKLAYTLNDSQCKGVIAADYAIAHILEIRDQLKHLEWIWILPSDEGEDVDPVSVDGAESMTGILSEPYTAMKVRVKTGKEPFEIIYTSGTTGDPKGVVRSNESYGSATMFGALVGFSENERPYTGLSLTHGNAQIMTLGPTLGMGLRTVFSRKFTKSRLWDITRKYDNTVFNLLGGMAMAIYSEPEREDDADNPVSFIVSAGMPIGIWESFEKRFNVNILECYGAIEGGFAVKPIGLGPVGSFGKPPPNSEMRIVNESDEECPPGVLGELVSRPTLGDQPEVEYFGNKDASDKKTRGGWLRSGDVCHHDEAGWFYFDYRIGGGIRHNGDFINPGFVEGVVAECQSVTDVFVYGVPAKSQSPGEKDIVVAIVSVDDEVFDPDEVFARCRRDLEPNFVPSYIQLVSEIPKTASEKPQERFLLEQFDEDLATVFTESAIRS
ncbi:MAG: AMP-binding protein [Proteobacteria bacterium]|nr:AMP-binding protein [Pseudomonadota bacterium]